MRFFFILCLTGLISHLSYPQNQITAQETDIYNGHIPAFGKISLSELELQACSFEKDASAMNLLRYETVEFEESGDNYKIKTVTTVRKKIFNENGFDNANIVIPYSGRNTTSEIVDIDAATYNLSSSGKMIVTEVNKKDIFKDKSGEKNGMNSVRFTFPDIKKGSVIELRYTRIEKNTFFIAPWFFQGNIPTLLSACEINSPPGVEVDQRIVASLPVDKDPDLDSYGMETKRSFMMHEIPSFKMEPFMSSVKDNLQRVEFSIIPHAGVTGIFTLSANEKWTLFNDILLSAPFFGKQLYKTVPGTESFADSQKWTTPSEQELQKVCLFVKERMIWNQQFTYYADDIARAWQSGSGSSAEINLILLNLLHRAHFKCYPILVSTRQNGKTDFQFPNLSQFNTVDVLVALGDDFYVLDGTEKYLSYKIPPFNVLNRDALIVDRYYSKWIHISDKRFLIRDSLAVKASLNKNGLLEGSAKIYYFDLSKTWKILENEEIKEKDNAEADDEEENILINDVPAIKVDTTIVRNKDDELLPLVEEIRFHTDLSSTNNFYFLNPFLLFSFDKNPFTDSTRSTDVDFGARQSHIMHMEINIPTDVTVVELIKDISTEDSILLFSLKNEFVNNQLIIDNHIDIKHSIFRREIYQALMHGFQKIYSELNQQILLKKKEE